MTENINNLELINKVSDMLRELSAYPLLVDHFAESIIFQDFAINLNMYLTEHKNLTENISNNKSD